MTPCSILLVDDHPIVMQGVKSLLAPVDDFVVCGMAKSGSEAISLTASLSPQIVVLDLMMPEMNGVETARCILQIRPQTRILIYTADEAQSYLPEYREKAK